MQNLQNSFDLLAFLKARNLLDNAPPLWWKNARTFEVVVGAILTQNTNWKNVESSLESLARLDLLGLESLANCDLIILQNAIKTSGFFRQKAIRLQNLAQNILNDFGDFERFTENVSREWLLNQKGIGKESADSILNYACGREIMVCDKYTQRLLGEYGFEFYEYDDIADFLMRGIVENYGRVVLLYGREIPLYEVYARFHGKIVEYSKVHKVKKREF
ncbi:3-methyladenine DNA glycosylase [Helicobacter sp. 23-1044]